MVFRKAGGASFLVCENPSVLGIFVPGKSGFGVPEMEDSVRRKCIHGVSFSPTNLVLCVWGDKAKGDIES